MCNFNLNNELDVSRRSSIKGYYHKRGNKI